MQPTLPTSRPSMTLPVKLITAFAILCALLVATLFLMRIFGLLRPFSVPTGAMSPAIRSGDHVFMENITFKTRKPHRGDIVVFSTDGIAGLSQGQYFVKRITGEPGERVRFEDGKLLINDMPVFLTNSAGRIIYNAPVGPDRFFGKTNVTVPLDSYFVSGDVSTNSLDSRYWGCLPSENIIGRVVICYWPPNRMGNVK